MYDYGSAESEIIAKLQRLDVDDYPYDFVRFTVRGGARDNAPPLLDISHVIREWNKRWAYPKLIFSTNHRFIQALEEHRERLPLLRGELPGTDYPIGATAAAKETGINRATHDRLLTSEKFATVAATVSDYVYPGDDIENAYTESLYYDLHCLGMHHIVGPAQEGDFSEKSTFAFKAAALSHDVLIKSCNKIVDEIKRDEDDYHLAVFNPLSYSRRDFHDGEIEMEWIDNSCIPGDHYYYAQIVFEGETKTLHFNQSPAYGNQAWTSPVWIRLAGEMK